MPDRLFDDPRMAALYDVFDDDRSDLDLYAALVDEVGAHRVVDLGCGTGTLALRLARSGLEVYGVDPALASLDVARGKPGAGAVTWVHGDAAAVGPWSADLATMTGNAAQAVLGDAWPATLTGVRRGLRPGGTFAFESRVPERCAWEQWTAERTRTRRDVVGVGPVEHWVELTEVTGALVSFRGTYVFPGGQRLTSDSTLQFRSLDELASDVETAGFALVDVRDAPDRPGLEHIVLARAATT